MSRWDRPGIWLLCGLPAILHGALAVAQTSHQKLPLKAAPPEPGMMDVGAALVAVLVLGAVALWAWLKLKGRDAPLLQALRRSPGATCPQSRLRVVERQSVSANVGLAVVEWQGEQLLMWHTSTAAGLLTRHPLVVPPSAPATEIHP